MQPPISIKAPRGGVAARYRAGVFSRVCAAIAGGYALAAALTALLSLALPMARAEAVLSATLFSFAAYAGAVLWVFAARSAARAWLGLLLPAALLGGAALVLYSLPWSAR
ncbi:DUF3649 domain-containing protein [Janthinobacterium fluminis]|uniref:DUF3649 domain-containing protein n=1 Tax=Janthinobacterium fluminis TaxID=2987524 RepID=A0ABT5K5E9_9BURK|nr:DUF3649 domain-containing protein [Janthinobacterium fluminis]MDC8758982.1 DUF3649 domain-containing protein [Janthinobacterium fluminis]